MTIKEFEWSLGNGQCPACYGHKPNANWWTDKIGHREECPLAELMKKAGMNPTFEHLNPDRVVGSYVDMAGPMPDLIVGIRDSDPNKKEKLELGKKQ